MSKTWFLVLAALVATLPGLSAATPQPAPRRVGDKAGPRHKPGSERKSGVKAEARAAYKRARTHYEAGRYAEAVVELKRAYELQPLDALLRYIGDSYYMLNKYRPALEFYRTYLKRTGASRFRARIELRVRELEKRLRSADQRPPQKGRKQKLPAKLVPSGRDTELPTELQPASAPAAQRTDGEVSAASRRDRDLMGTILRVAKWSAVGLSAAALAVGVTFQVLARNRAGKLEDTVRNACPAANPGCGGNPNLDRPVTGYTPQEYHLQRTYLHDQSISIGFLVGAGAAAAAAIVLFVLDWPKRSSGRNVSLVPSVGTTGLMLTGQGRF